MKEGRGGIGENGVGSMEGGFSRLIFLPFSLSLSELGFCSSTANWGFLFMG